MIFDNDAVYVAARLSQKRSSIRAAKAKKDNDQVAQGDHVRILIDPSQGGTSLVESMKNALANMPPRWSMFRLDPGKIKTVAFAMLYHKKDRSHTPAEYATTELLPSLPNARQVILTDTGHVDDSRFVNDPMDFEPPVSLSLWAKVRYPFVAIAGLF